MHRLLQVFVDIALWRKGPQDLPTSTALLAFVSIGYAGLSYAQVRLAGIGVRPAALLSAIDIAMVFAWFAFTLSLFGLRPRLWQALTAVLGVGTLVALVDVAFRGVLLLSGAEATDSFVWALSRLMLVLLLTGRIFALTIERGLMTGMSLTLAMIFSTEAIAGLFVDLRAVANVQGQ